MIKNKQHKITFITVCDGPFRRAEIDKPTGSTKHHF